MALTSDIRAVREREQRDDLVVAVVDVEELEAARRDPRVRAFHEEADSYLADLQREGRDR